MYINQLGASGMLHKVLKFHSNIISVELVWPLVVCCMILLLCLSYYITSHVPL